jgi:hypothetical protein
MHLPDAKEGAQNPGLNAIHVDEQSSSPVSIPLTSVYDKQATRKRGNRLTFRVKTKE